MKAIIREYIACLILFHLKFFDIRKAMKKIINVTKLKNIRLGEVRPKNIVSIKNSIVLFSILLQFSILRKKYICNG